MRNSVFAVAALALSASAAGATTINVSSFDVTDYNTQLTGLGPSTVSQDFETFAESNVGGVGSAFKTNVGDFETLGGTGTGKTVTNADNTFTGTAGANPNDGSQLAIRDRNVFGRVSTTSAIAGGGYDPNGKFLDSNDTWGISWDVDLGGASFTEILLTLTDAADSGATVTITTDDGGFNQFQSQPRSNQKTVLIEFTSAVLAANVMFSNTNGPGGAPRTNDGLALDDIVVATVPSGILPTVPLPASVLFLGAGIAGLGLLRRRRKLT
ncbi:MAG: VPLPA-CTERM sorting domain-containing protein [Pseudomonadota bacterium]